MSNYWRELGSAVMAALVVLGAVLFLLLVGVARLGDGPQPSSLTYLSPLDVKQSVVGAGEPVTITFERCNDEAETIPVEGTTYWRSDELNLSLVAVSGIGEIPPGCSKVVFDLPAPERPARDWHIEGLACKRENGFCAPYESETFEVRDDRR